MEKTYEALIERLKKSYKWEAETARMLECQPDLSNHERIVIERRKAVAEYLARIIRVETGEEVTE